MTRRRSLHTALLVPCLVVGSALHSRAQDHPAHTIPKPAAEQSGNLVPPLTDADREAAFPSDLHGHAVHDKGLNLLVLFDQLEWHVHENANGLLWDAKSWIGGDRHRVWLRSEGESEQGRLEDAEVHVLFGRAISPWWDLVAGVRQDFRPGPARMWAAAGIQGLAPQWFEVEATAYVGESGRTAARFEVEYELLVTNRIVLQPLVELNILGKSDPERGLAAGVTTAEIGARLRYEFKREFAPYLGVVWQRRLAGTADLARAAGGSVGGWRLAGGVRLWF